MDFAHIDNGTGFRQKADLQNRAKVHGFSFVSELVFDWFYIQKKGITAIARALDISTPSIYRWMDLWGFVSPSRDVRIVARPAACFRGELEYSPINMQVVRELWIRVLQQAFDDLTAEEDPGDFKVERERARALSWISDTTDIVCPSFIWVTELLKLDPGAVRKVVLK